ncbi:MAG: DUF2339 domain-containing protein, partial [Acidobacteriota bacterium]|nr:DUF2339 domain-containing protein [Acidobacteriota bacterium]
MGCAIYLLSAFVLGGGLLIFFFRRRLEETRARVAGLETELAILRRRIDSGAAVIEAGDIKPAESIVEPFASEREPVVEPVAPVTTVESEELESTPGRSEPAEIEAPAVSEEPFETPEPVADSPQRPPIRIDWEQWIGVRGAALLGGIVLALAAVLFLKFSIEHGLIPPIVRVALGLMTGVGALAASEVLRKKEYSTTANSLAGAGIVILYASIWAARALYDLIPIGLAFVFMILVTLVCGLLSWRHRSLVIAVLGLVGGFATPLLLSTGSNRPVGLFGYILLLDVGLLTLARKQRWPLLAALGLGGTALYQLLWIFGRMEPEQALLGLAVLALFGLLFAAVGTAGEGRAERAVWRLTSWAGVFLPFVFAVYFAGRSTLDFELWQLGLLLAILSLAALELGKRHGQPLLGTGAAAACVGVFLVWVVRTRVYLQIDNSLAWEAVGVAIALSVVFHLRGLRNPEEEAPSRLASATASTLLQWAEPGFVAAAGLLVPLILASVINGTSLWPWLTGWLAIVALLVHQAGGPGRGYRSVVAAVALAIGFFLFFAAHGLAPFFPSPPVFFGLAVAVAVGFQFVAIQRRSTGVSFGAEIAAAVFPLILLLGLSTMVEHPALGPKVFLATTLVLAFLAVLAATRGRMGFLYPVAVGLLAFCHTTWVQEYFRWDVPPPNALGILLALAAAGGLLTFWPFVAGKMFAGDRWVLYGAALAAPAWFFALRKVWVSRFGDAAIGALPILLGLMALGASVLARKQFGGDGDEPERQRSLVWFLAVAMGFVTLAIPLQLDKEWVTIGWALQGLAMTLLW